MEKGGGQVVNIFVRRRQDPTRVTAGVEHVRGQGEAWWFLAPTILGLIVFTAGPVVASFLISFTNWDIVQPPNFVGWSNYQALVHSALFWQTFRNTVVYTLMYVPLVTAWGLFLAVLTQRSTRVMQVFRTVFFTPVVTSMVAVALVWELLAYPNFGVLNYFLSSVGVTAPNWLGSTTWALPTLAIMGAWKGSGLAMLFFLSGLQNIPVELYEAAGIDGAGGWRKFTKVTWPLLSPTTFFVLVVSVIGSFQIFDQTYIMTQGGPAFSTITLSYAIFQYAFQYFNMGTASAMAYILFALILVVTVGQFVAQRRWVFYR